MSFDDDPSFEREVYQCPLCDEGDVYFNEETGLWECDVCDFASNGADNGNARE